MSLLYLIRHGQAGTRDRYDRLSDLGRRQSLLLGEYLARESARFDHVWTGALARQRETAEDVLGVLAEAGLAQPEPVIDARWNEFDLDAVYAGIAPQLAADDAEFRAYYETLQQALAVGRAEVHRQWTPADSAVVKAWIHQRYRFIGESWDDFVVRVHAAGEGPLAAVAAGRCVAVFTSATPVSITLSRILPMDPGQIMQLTGAALNTNLTILRVNGVRPSLLSFNCVPHLDNAELRTFR